MANKEELIQQIADKYHVPKQEVAKAVNSQFKYSKQFMESDNLPQVRLPFFGVFKPSLRKLKQIQKHNERNKTSRQEQ